MNYYHSTNKGTLPLFIQEILSMVGKTFLGGIFGITLLQ